MLRRIALTLALGFAATVAIAWLGAFFERAYTTTSYSETLVFPGHTSSYYFTEGWIITRNNVNWRDDASQAVLNPGWIDAASPAARSVAHAPSWSKAWSTTRPVRPPATWSRTTGESTLSEFAAGFPFRAFTSECDEPTQDPVTKLAVYPPTRGGIGLPCHVIKDGATIFLPRSLPYRPLWLGLAADVAVFSLLLTPLTIVSAARRAWRLRHGRCLRCGYDRRGLAAAHCPECGPLVQSPPGDSASCSRQPHS